MSKKRRLKKILLITGGTVLLLVIIVIACISPISKHLLQKYDVKLLGREITVESAYVNPFTGFVRFGGLKIFEQNSDSAFLTAGSLSADLAMLKLAKKTYEITELTLDEPVAHIYQNKKSFNFDDILEKFKGDTTEKKPEKEPAHFNMLSLKISNGHFYYHETSIPVHYSIKDVNIECPAFKWDVDTLQIKYNFSSGDAKGKMNGDIVINKTTSDYRLATKIDKYDLRFLEQYLRDLSNFGRFRANLDADINARGNFKEARNVNARGQISLNDFHVGENTKEDYASFKRFVIQIEHLSPGNKIYKIDSLSLVKPYFKYEKYDYLNNLEMMFGKKGAKASNPAETNLIVQIGDYIAKLAKNFFKSDYKVNRLAIYNGSFKYNDYSFSEKFGISADPITVIADSIKHNSKPVDFSFTTGIKPYGSVALKLSINPKDSSDFDLHYNFDQLPAAMFNPILVSMTSFPLDRGTIEIKGDWHVRNGNINSVNRLVVIDPRIHNRVEGADNKWIPLKLITFFVRERGNVIDYEIPIKGNLKDPKFNLWDIITDVLQNTFLKPVRTPYISHVRTVEREIEKSLILRWDMKKSSLTAGAEDLVDELADFLEKNPSVAVNVHQAVYGEKEREHIVLHEAKKKYFLDKNNKKEEQLSEDDIKSIDDISIKDTLFKEYLGKKVKNKFLFPVQEKCLALVGSKVVKEKFKQLLSDRKENFLKEFKDRQVADRIKFNDVEDKVPYNGFSIYRIDYQGELPAELTKAYEKMKQLNDRQPRKKFKRDREKRSGLIRAQNK